MTLTKSDLDITDSCFVNPILATLDIYKGPHETTIKGQLKTDIQLQCDRCLEMYHYPLNVNFQSILSPIQSIDSKNDENIIPITNKTDEVDLSPFAYDALLIGLPMKSICSDTCKGICAGCGVNLNQETCKCETNNNDDRWNPLANLLTNRPEE